MNVLMYFSLHRYAGLVQDEFKRFSRAVRLYCIFSVAFYKSVFSDTIVVAVIVIFVIVLFVGRSTFFGDTVWARSFPHLPPVLLLSSFLPPLVRYIFVFYSQKAVVFVIEVTVNIPPPRPEKGEVGR